MVMQSSYVSGKFYMFLPLELTLQPSRIYPAILVLAHGLALAGVWLAALPLGIKALAVAALLAGAVWLWRENANSPHGLRVSQSGQVELLDEEWRAASVLGRPLVLPRFVSLMLELDTGRKRRLMLWSDSTDPELFRKFRVWLKWGNLPEGKSRSASLPGPDRS
jgi:hypothetical protein